MAGDGPPTAGEAESPGVDYFEHAADIGVIGRGATVEEAFVHAAEATFAVMADLAAIRPLSRFRVRFEEDDAELALARWLNRLLAEARSRRLALGKFAVRRKGNRWEGEAWGEPWHPGLDRGVEVKGATLTMLSVRANGGRWDARCVVDV
ncbi:MAG: archease [Chloroflexi bacterium]|nr:archease [Chloroflexota bacterium]